MSSLTNWQHGKSNGKYSISVKLWIILLCARIYSGNVCQIDHLNYSEYYLMFIKMQIMIKHCQISKLCFIRKFMHTKVCNQIHPWFHIKLLTLHLIEYFPLLLPCIRVNKLSHRIEYCTQIVDCETIDL